MSFDLLVFDPSLAPENDEEFAEWYKSLLRWDRPEDNNDPNTSSPALQKFFGQLSKSFPSMGLSDIGASEPNREQGSLVSLMGRLLRGKRQPESARELPEGFDEACFTEYSFGKDAIYMCFAWSVSEPALHATVDAALKSNVGFYNASANNPRPIRNRKDLIALRHQTLPSPAPKFTKADLFTFLKEDGWSITRDADDGSRSATRVEGDRSFQLFPRISYPSGGTCVHWGESVVPLKYLDAISLIDEQPHSSYPLRLQRGTRLKQPNLTVEQVTVELEKIVDRLREEDLNAALEETANLPLSSPGNAPLRLLAAKACRGDYSYLRELTDKMKSGDRQGFVPYISIEHLERALEACAQLNQELT